MVTADAAREFIHERCSMTGEWVLIDSSDDDWEMYSNDSDIDWKTVSEVRISPALLPGIFGINRR